LRPPPTTRKSNPWFGKAPVSLQSPPGLIIKLALLLDPFAEEEKTKGDDEAGKMRTLEGELANDDEDEEEEEEEEEEG